VTTDESYDPEADLVALRTDGRARFGVYALFASAVFLLGTYLQSLLLVGPTIYMIWIHAKVGLIAALVVTAMQTSKLRPRVRLLYPAVALVAFLEAGAWVALLILRASGTFSCFSYASIPASLFALLFTPFVLSALTKADAARDRLAANGIDDPYA